jgi:3-hydroxybutyryl-CoA dehydrogenase
VDYDSLPTVPGKVGVVGAGVLGSGIAQVCLQSGFEVLLIDHTEEALAAGEGLILRGLHRAEQPAAFGRLRKATRLQRLQECDLAIECSAESPQAKQDLLCRVDAQMPPDRIVGIHTPALTVGLLTRGVENPERFVGLNFFHPVPHTKLAEVAAGAMSSPEAVEGAVGFAGKLGKTALSCKDAPGFMVHRLACAQYRAALRLFEEGLGTPAGIDGALRSAGAMRVGPFEAMDWMGLDESLSVSATIYELLGRPDRLKPSRVQQALVKGGWLGRKDNGGFYVYDEGQSGVENPALYKIAADRPTAAAEPRALLAAVIKGGLAEARFMVSEGVAAPRDIDVAARLGLHWPRGPFEWEGKPES